MSVHVERSGGDGPAGEAGSTHEAALDLIERALRSATDAALPPERTRRPLPPSGEWATGAIVEMTAAVVQRLFAVGLDLAACAQLVHAPAAERLAKAIDDLDGVIAQIRTAVFHQINAAEVVGSDRTADAGPAGVDDIAEQLGPLAARLTLLAGSDQVGHGSVVALGDAAHSLHHALAVLADQSPPSPSRHP